MATLVWWFDDEPELVARCGCWRPVRGNCGHLTGDGKEVSGVLWGIGGGNQGQLWLWKYKRRWWWKGRKKLETTESKAASTYVLRTDQVHQQWRRVSKYRDESQYLGRSALSDTAPLWYFSCGLAITVQWDIILASSVHRTSKHCVSFRGPEILMLPHHICTRVESSVKDM